MDHKMLKSLKKPVELCVVNSLCYPECLILDPMKNTADPDPGVVIPDPMALIPHPTLF